MNENENENDEASVNGEAGTWRESTRRRPLPWRIVSWIPRRLCRCHGHRNSRLASSPFLLPMSPSRSRCCCLCGSTLFRAFSPFHSSPLGMILPVPSYRSPAFSSLPVPRAHSLSLRRDSAVGVAESIRDDANLTAAAGLSLMQ